ncbi:unnamed protein product [Allacma fusca]|uniref:Dynein light chain roadblock n=1 Tax=Allacma fusca TaxID=39272 RepID=A0A8J2LI14_9HEXA|nr:unnamed protein product [Allacma fusca]
MQADDIDDTVKRIAGHRGVLGVIIAARDGMPIKTTMDNTSTVLYVGTAIALFERSQSLVRDVDPSNALQFMRIRTAKYELMVSVEEEYIVVAVQNTKFTE